MAEPITITPAPEPLSFEGWTCPLPLRDSPTIVMGHGGGGAMSGELVEHVFLPAFADDDLAKLGDSAVLPLLGGRVAFSTDSFVVRPLFFPGGSIGELAVNGTVNDLAMSGAEPLYLTAAFVLEEGFAVAELAEVVRRMASAARAASSTRAVNPAPRSRWSMYSPANPAPTTITSTSGCTPAPDRVVPPLSAMRPR